MKTFYKDDMTVEERNKLYAEKNMSEIQDLEQKRFGNNVKSIDEMHKKFMDESRKHMLTVAKLIAWLQTQDPDACVLAYEPNSNAYIEQLDDLPNDDISDAAKAKKDLKDSLLQWYKDTEDGEDKAEKQVQTVFRYAKDNDVIIKFN